MKNKAGRYSRYIRPTLLFLDLLIINLLVLVLLRSAMSNFGYHTVLTLFWLIISYYSGYYEVYRFTKGIEILGKLLNQFFFTSLITFAYVGYKYKFVTTQEIGYYIFWAFLAVAFLKFSLFYFLKKYRLFYGGNFRKVIIVGNGKSAEELKDFFANNPDYGYNLVQIFGLKVNKKLEISEAKKYVIANKIDEIYASINSLTNNEIDNIIHFADNNLKTIKL